MALVHPIWSNKPVLTKKKQKLKGYFLVALFARNYPGLTPGLLRVLHRQLGHNKKATQAGIAEKWKGVCLNQVLHQWDASQKDKMV